MAEKPSKIPGIFEIRLAEQNRCHKAHIDQVTQATKKEPRRNSSDQGRVGQPSKATKNGAERSGKSKNSKKFSQPVEPSTKTPRTKNPKKQAASKGKGKVKNRCTRSGQVRGGSEGRLYRQRKRNWAGS